MKHGTLECKQHKTVSLMSHIKIIVRIIMERNKQNKKWGVRRTVWIYGGKGDKERNFCLENDDWEGNRNAERFVFLLYRVWKRIW